MGASTALRTGELSIVSREGLFQIKISLHNHKDLYYCTSDMCILTLPHPQSMIFGWHQSEWGIWTHLIYRRLSRQRSGLFGKGQSGNGGATQTWHQYPQEETQDIKSINYLSEAARVEAELWMVWLGFPSSWKMEVTTTGADGLPTKFDNTRSQRQSLKCLARSISSDLVRNLLESWNGVSTSPSISDPWGHQQMTTPNPKKPRIGLSSRTMDTAHTSW